MIIRTRYRDVPFEEIQKIFGPDIIRSNWERLRGTEVEIITPGHEVSPINEFTCGCKWIYSKAHPTRKNGAVCPCVAEIGD